MELGTDEAGVVVMVLASAEDEAPPMVIMVVIPTAIEGFNMPG